MRWATLSAAGECDLVDISPGGACLSLPPAQAAPCGTEMTLEMRLAPNLRWQVTEAARVIRRTPLPDGTCRLGLAFPDWEIADV